MSAAPPVDVRALVADIEATVARRRAAGEYPEDLLRSLRAEFRVAPREESVAALAFIDTHQPPLSRRPLVGAGIVFGKRLLRRSIAWYVQPIAVQQTRFNRAASVQLRALEERIARLETPWSRSVPVTSPRLEAPGRVEALLRAIEPVGVGQVLLIEVDGAQVGERLRQSWPRDDTVLDVVQGDPIAALAGRESGGLAAVVLPGVLPALSAADLIEICAAAARRLRAGGRIILDCPEPEAADRIEDASSVDPGMVRWVHRSTTSLLCEAAGFEQVTVEDVEGGWYGVVAARPA